MAIGFRAAPLRELEGPSSYRFAQILCQFWIQSICYKLLFWRCVVSSTCHFSNMPKQQLTKCQVDKMSVWQNAKLTKCQVDKMPSWQNVKLTNCQVDKMSSWQNAKLTKCQVDKMPSWQNAKLTKSQVDKMSGWQNVKLTKWYRIIFYCGF